MTCPDEEVLLDFAAGSLPMGAALEVERHLRECDDCCLVLAEGAEALGGSAQRTPQPSDVTLETEGRYQLLRELGEGAEGRVFAAWDHHLAREVALKVPHLESALRPLREARLVARLDHPGIATVFEIGRRADGSLYSVQRLVHAEHGPRSLRHAFDQLRTLPERLGLLPRLLQVCQAVGYAHAKGVVHRDLKPENIALGDGGETVVLDWGLALQLDSNDAAEARRPVGTRGYMSPEQAAGLPVGAQTDVYSLGVMLRELLEVAAPALRPKPLVAIAERACATDPVQRYPTADALSSELTAWLSGGVVQAHDYAVSEVLARSFRRHRLAIFALGVVAIGALAAMVQIVRTQRRAQTAFAGVLLQKASEAQSGGAWDLAAAYSAAARELNDSEAARMSLAATRGRSRLESRVTLVASGPVSALAVNARGDVLAAGRGDGRIAIFGPGALEPVRMLAGHRALIVALAFSAEHLFSSSSDGQVLMWDLGTGQSRVLTDREDAVNALAVAPDGSWVATGAEDGYIEVFALPGGASLAKWRAHTTPLYALAVDPSGQQLASGSWDGHLSLWTRSGALVSSLDGHGDAVESLAFSPDGAHLASASRDRSVRVWPMRFDGAPQVLLGHSQRLSAVVWLDDQHLQSTGDDGQVRSWAVRDRAGSAQWQCVSLERIDQGGASLVALRGGGSVVGGDQGALFRFGEPRVMALQLPWRERVSHLDVQDGGVLMVESLSFVWRDLQSEQVVARQTFEEIQPAQARVLPDGRLFWAGYSTEKSWLFLRARDGTDQRIGSAPRVWSLVLDPDAHWGAVLGGSPTLELRSMADGDAGVTLGGHQSDIFAAALGRTLAVTASYDKTIGVFALPGGERVQTLKGHWHGVRAVALSPEEALVASGGWDKTVRLWDPKQGSLEATLFGHQSYVTAVAFSPSGRLLASVSWDGTLIVWDVATRQPLLRQEHVENGPRSVQWFGDEVLRIGGTRMTRVDLSPAAASGPETLAELGRTRGMQLDGASATRVDFGGPVLEGAR